MDARSQHATMVRFEIKRLQEKPDASAALRADRGPLFAHSPGQKEIGLRVSPSNANPAFFIAKSGIFKKVKSQRACEKADGFVIVGNEDCHEGEVGQG